MGEKKCSIQTLLLQRERLKNFELSCFPNSLITGLTQRQQSRKEQDESKDYLAN